MRFVHKIQCMCVCLKKKKNKCLTHTHEHQARQVSLLTAWLPPLHACVCMVYNVFLHLFWNYIISNTFQYVWTPALFCCTLWTCSFLPTYNMYFSFPTINFAFLVAAVSGFWLSKSGNWLSDTFYVKHFTKQMICGLMHSFFLLSNGFNWSPNLVNLFWLKSIKSYQLLYFMFFVLNDKNPLLVPFRILKHNLTNTGGGHMSDHNIYFTWKI